LADRIEIVSAAQHALLKRAAEDERYAAERRKQSGAPDRRRGLIFLSSARD